ncbi:hypothetical protein D3C80_1139420 [compost metagenome]
MFNLTNPDVLAAKQYRLPRRFDAGQQMQGAYREIKFFKDLDKGLAHGTGGADHGDIERLAHANTSGKTGGAELYSD